MFRERSFNPQQAATELECVMNHNEDLPPRPLQSPVTHMCSARQPQALRGAVQQGVRTICLLAPSFGGMSGLSSFRLLSWAQGNGTDKGLHHTATRRMTRSVRGSAPSAWLPPVTPPHRQAPCSPWPVRRGGPLSAATGPCASLANLYLMIFTWQHN